MPLKLEGCAQPAASPFGLATMADPSLPSSDAQSALPNDSLEVLLIEEMRRCGEAAMVICKVPSQTPAEVSSEARALKELIDINCIARFNTAPSTWATKVQRHC
jgi:hypothetical protein